MLIIMADELLDLLNKAIARELGVSIQYMWHHVMAMGMESPEIKDVFKEIAIVEMKHAEDIAERLFYLGGTPTTKPTPIKVGGSLKEMIEANLQAEIEAVAMYKEIIDKASEKEDTTTRLLFEEILTAEEEHKHTFSILLK
ncbi:MAG: ferritin-like domain-containing protein [Candidatus Methanoperedens sp.]|nr:ferritin-like domain-containing protein [Candidatus Methanoperedens sp.]MCZ7394598.1 ferritin-like domain-containing protein [Candidatus Methanoperedens sp.]